MGLFRPQTDKQIPMLRGDLYRATHQASVDAILGAGVRRVYSRGARFYNYDFWPLRIFVVHFCSWVSRNPGVRPTPTDLAPLVAKANSERVPRPHIVIAATPELLSLPVAWALIGGSYHEAWHTLYSRRTPITVPEVWAIIDHVWDALDDTKTWARLAGAINYWSNLVEDIRIERCGNREFPGAVSKMHDLQDFILDQEEEGRATASHRELPESALNAGYPLIAATFRDLGLGYDSGRQNRALAAYKERNPQAVEFVTNGPLTALLHESIALQPQQNAASLRIAMQVVAAICNAKAQEKPPEEQPDQPEDSKPTVSTCPNCGAPGSKLRIRPKAGMPDTGTLVCTACAYEEDVPLSKKKGGKGGIGLEGGDPEDATLSADSKDGDGNSKDEKDGNSKDGNSKDEKDGNSKDEKDGNSKDEKDGNSKDEKDGNSKDEKDGNSKDEKADQGAGGHQWEEGPSTAWADFVEEILEQAAACGGNPAGLLDNNEALEAAFNAVKDNEDSHCQTGESAYRPYDRTQDSMTYVEVSNQGLEADAARAQRILASVQSQCSYLRARLRSIVRAMEQTSVEHGVRRGRGLSERRFTEDRADLLAGQVPSRPDFDREEQMDTSMAAVVVMDQSSSMSGLLVVATQAFMALTEPLDALGCATMAVGFRDGVGVDDDDDDDDPHQGSDNRAYHRTDAVHIDVFKAFHERFNTVKWRFANTRAVGGTPMADGVQVALEQLSSRPEAHRIVFVVTDGMPNPRHPEVLRRQIRLARESGILVIGVGLTQASRSVLRTFPDAVYVPEVENLSTLLIAKLNEILDFRGLKRGRRLKTAV